MNERPPLTQAEAQRLMSLRNGQSGAPQEQPLPMGVKGQQIAEEFEALPLLEQYQRGTLENLSNMGNRVLDKFDKATGAVFGAPPINGPWEPKRSGSGAAYNLGVGTSNLVPSIALSLLLKRPVNLAGANIGASGLLHEDFGQGLAEGAKGEIIANSIPYVGKFAGQKIGALGEKITRSKYGEQVKEGIKNAYETVKKEAYEPVERYVKDTIAEEGAKFKDFAKNTLSSSKAGTETSKHVKRVVDKSLFDTGLATGDIETYANKFRAKPTIENAQELKTLLHGEVSALNPSDIANRNAIKEYNKAIKSLETGIYSTLEEQSPGLGKVWRNSNKEWATQKIPFDKNSIIADVAEGKGHKYDLNDIKSAIEDVSYGNNPIAGPEHYLSKQLPEIQGKLGRSELYSKATHALGGGIGGAVSGLLAGNPLAAAIAGIGGAGLGLAYKGNFLSKEASEQLAKMMAKSGGFKTPFQTGVRALYGSEEQPPNPYYQ